MIVHWMSTGVNKHAILSAARYARNLDPTNPVPWIALAATSLALAASNDKRESAKGAEEATKLIEDLNALEHAIELNPTAVSDYAVVTLARQVYSLQFANQTESDDFGVVHELARSLLRRVMVHMVRYVERRGGAGTIKFIFVLKTKNSSFSSNLLTLCASQIKKVAKPMLILPKHTISLDCSK